MGVAWVFLGVEWVFLGVVWINMGVPGLGLLEPSKNRCFSAWNYLGLRKTRGYCSSQRVGTLWNLGVSSSSLPEQCKAKRFPSNLSYRSPLSWIGCWLHIPVTSESSCPASTKPFRLWVYRVYIGFFCRVHVQIAGHLRMIEVRAHRGYQKSRLHLWLHQLFGIHISYGTET